MSRHHWEYEYTGSEIIEAVKDKVDYHAERLNFWTKEKLKCEKELKENGVSIEGYDVTGGRRYEAKLDNSLANRYTEAWDKCESHGNMMDKFHSYLRALEHNPPTKVYYLNLDDVEFFDM